MTETTSEPWLPVPPPEEGHSPPVEPPAAEEECPPYDYVADPRYCGKQTDAGGVTVTCWRQAGHCPSYHQGERLAGEQFTWRVEPPAADAARVIREALVYYRSDGVLNMHQKAIDALAALDALLAERTALREALADGREYLSRGKIDLAVSALESVPRGEVLGTCPHDVDLDREFCPQGCRR